MNETLLCCECYRHDAPLTACICICAYVGD